MYDPIYETTFAPPRPPDGVTALWRRTFTGIDETRTGDDMLVGVPLEVGVQYSGPTLSRLVACDDIPGTGPVLTLWRTGSFGKPEQQRERFVLDDDSWNPDGAMISRLRWHLTGGTHGGEVKILGGQITEQVDCDRCGTPIGTDGPPRGIRLDSGDVVHINCPKPPKPKQPNRYPGYCDRCFGWMLPGEGHLAPLTGTGAVHAGPCPPPSQRREAPARRNERAQPCDQCFLTVPAGDGWLTRRRDGWHVVYDECPHAGELAEAPATLHVQHDHRDGGAFTRGTVIRVLWQPAREPDWDAADIIGRTDLRHGEVTGGAWVVRAATEHTEDDDTGRPLTIHHADVRPATQAEVDAHRAARAAARTAVAPRQDGIAWPEPDYVDAHGIVHPWDAPAHPGGDPSYTWKDQVTDWAGGQGGRTAQEWLEDNHPAYHDDEDD